MSTKLAQAQSEKTELELRETTYKESIEDIKDELLKTEKSLRSELTHEKTSSKKIIDDIKGRLAKEQDSKREVENLLFIKKSEFEKEKALLQHKAQYLETCLEE